MKATGVVRQVDRLGRIVVPVELRRNLQIEFWSDIEIWVDGDNIVLTKFVPGCVFCGKKENTVLHKEKIVCHDCKLELKTEIPSEMEAKAVNV